MENYKITISPYFDEEIIDYYESQGVDVTQVSLLSSAATTQAWLAPPSLTVITVRWYGDP